MKDYTREELVSLCERAIVPVEKWRNRDTSAAQEQVGRAWALLKAGCDWSIDRSMYRNRPDEHEHTIWVNIVYPGFGSFDWGGSHDDETFYIPTAARMDARPDSDWY